MGSRVTNILVAGKLALSVQGACASGLGKSGEETYVAPELSLTQIGVPYDILTAPGTTSDSKSGTIGNEGEIYTQLAANQRLDFLIEGIRSDMEVDIYLAYSSGADRDDLWVPFTEGQGQIELDTEGLNLIAAYRLPPATSIVGEGAESPLGTLQRSHESITIPVQLSDLADLGTHGEKLYFQALAIPRDENGELQWSLAQASEVDIYNINTTDFSNDDYDGKIGGDSDNTDGKTTGGDDSSDTGGK